MDPESVRWRGYRRVYRALLWILFLIPAIFVLPNVYQFGKLTPLTIADFVPMVNRDCRPVVIAVKTYERDMGHLPDSMGNLVPHYLASWSARKGEIYAQTIYFYDLEGRETVSYRLDPAAEGWAVQGHFVTGPVPVPIVTLPPMMHR